MAVKPVPDDYGTVTPYLILRDPDGTIAFLKEVFGAEEHMRMEDPAGGGLRHAEVKLGDSRLMLAAATPEWPPQPGAFYVYVEDVDATYAQAVAAGATSLMEPADQFYGDRHGGVEDANGNRWWIATHVEDVSPEEVLRRAEASAATPSSGTAPAAP